MGFGNIFSNKPELYSLWRMRLRWAELLAVVGRESCYKVSAALLCSCERAIKASKIVHRSSKAASTIIWIFFLASSPSSLEIHCWFFSSLLFMSTHFGSSTVVGWNSIGDCGFSFEFISRCVVACAKWNRVLNEFTPSNVQRELCFPHTRDSIVDARTQCSLLLVGVSRYLTAVLPFPHRVSHCHMCVAAFFPPCARQTLNTHHRAAENNPEKKAGIHIGLIILWAIKYNCASNYKFTRCSLLCCSRYTSTQ